MDQNQISPARAKQYVQEVFAKLGMPHEDTLIAAEYIVRADLVGADGHGLFRMPQYVQRFLQGGMNIHANIKTIKDSGPMALLDGDCLACFLFPVLGKGSVVLLVQLAGGVI